METKIKKGKKIKMKWLIIIVIAVIIVIIGFKFSKVEKAAQERFSMYKAKAQSVETSYGTISYIDEGKGEVILS